MRMLPLVLAVATAALLCLADETRRAAPHATAASRHAAVRAQGLTIVPLCPGGGGPGTSRCLAHALALPSGAPVSFASPALSPAEYIGAADIRAAYNIPAGLGEGVTVGIVDAYDHPNAEADLAAYRAHFGLPPCTSRSGCFRKVNQRGAAGPLPIANQTWAQEIALDIEMVSAACPRCRILLVEADDNLFVNQEVAVRTAVRLGATVLSLSWGADEVPEMDGRSEPYDFHVPIFASSGDLNFTVSYPSSLPNVISVGGTTLSKDSLEPRGWFEEAWFWEDRMIGAGCGCSLFFPKPGFQKDTGCPRRTTADVSAVADLTLVVYDGGWYLFGGTSVSAPVVASIVASVNLGPVTDASWFYAHPGALFDVTSGGVGMCASEYLCTAVPGYDGPTGLGTPNVAAMLAQRARACSVTISGFPSAFKALNGAYAVQKGSLKGGKPWYRGPKGQRLFYENGHWKIHDDVQGKALWATTQQNTATPEQLPSGASWRLSSDKVQKGSTRLHIGCKA